MMKPRFWTLVGMIGMAAVAALHASSMERDADRGDGALWRRAVPQPRARVRRSPSRHASRRYRHRILSADAAHLCVLRRHGDSRILDQAEYQLGAGRGGIADGLRFVFCGDQFGHMGSGSLYPKTGPGLVALLYRRACRSLRNTLFGDLGYTALLFGSFYLAGRTFPVLSDARAS